VVIYGSEYWKHVFNLETLVGTGAISPKDIELFQFADTPEAAFDILKRGLTENYLVPEAEAAQAASGDDASHKDDLLAGWTFEDFLSPEMAKTRS